MRVLRDSVLFKFAADASTSTLSAKTEWGFEITKKEEGVNKPQWGIVEQVGPEVTQFKVGDWIFIDALRWTTKCDFRGESFWRTRQRDVLLVSDKPVSLL